jgi:hypothetical protein
MTIGGNLCLFTIHILNLNLSLNLNSNLNSNLDSTKIVFNWMPEYTEGYIKQCERSPLESSS